MTVLITGADGYLGWPTALRIASQTTDRVVLVDNLARREWVESVGSRSAVPIGGMAERLAAAEEVHGLRNLSFVEGDLTDRAVVDELLSVHEPRRSSTRPLNPPRRTPRSTVSGRTIPSIITCRRPGIYSGDSRNTI